MSRAVRKISKFINDFKAKRKTSLKFLFLFIPILLLCQSSIHSETLDKLRIQYEISQFESNKKTLMDRVWSNEFIAYFYGWQPSELVTKGWSVVVSDLGAFDAPWDYIWLQSDMERFADLSAARCKSLYTKELDLLACASRLTRRVLHRWDSNVSELDGPCTYYSVFFKRVVRQLGIVSLKHTYFPLTARDENGKLVNHLLNKVEYIDSQGLHLSLAIDSLYFAGKFFPLDTGTQVYFQRENR